MFEDFSHFLSFSDGSADSSGNWLGIMMVYSCRGLWHLFQADAPRYGLYSLRDINFTSICRRSSLPALSATTAIPEEVT